MLFIVPFSFLSIWMNWEMSAIMGMSRFKMFYTAYKGRKPQDQSARCDDGMVYSGL